MSSSARIYERPRSRPVKVETYTGSQQRKHALTAAQQCMPGLLAGGSGCRELAREAGARATEPAAQAQQSLRRHSALPPHGCQPAHRAATLGQLNVDGQAAGEGALPVGAPQVGQRRPAVCARGGHADGGDCTALAHSLQVIMYPRLSMQPRLLAWTQSLVGAQRHAILQRILSADSILLVVQAAARVDRQCRHTLCRAAGCRQGSAAAALLSSTMGLLPCTSCQAPWLLAGRLQTSRTAHLCKHAEPCARPADAVDRYSNVLLGLAGDLSHGHRDVASSNIANLQQCSRVLSRQQPGTAIGVAGCNTFRPPRAGSLVTQGCPPATDDDMDVIDDGRRWSMFNLEG